MSALVDVACPVCCELVEDVELNVSTSEMREEFWGAPVGWTEAEVEVVHIPECPSCKRVTLEPDVVSDWFWSQEVASHA